MNDIHVSFASYHLPDPRANGLHGLVTEQVRDLIVHLHLEEPLFIVIEEVILKTGFEVVVAEKDSGDYLVVHCMEVEFPVIDQVASDGAKFDLN